MTTGFIVTGTDTGIGKTVFSAALTQALSGYYWKPIQAGLDGETDSQTVAKLSNLPLEQVLPEAYRLGLPASPHIAAVEEGIEIDVERLALPRVDGPLVVEGAGGLMVPLTPTYLQVDIFARWRLPIVLCARTALGTINHTLLSIEALRNRNMKLWGVAFIGDANEAVERTIEDVGAVKRLGRLPFAVPLTQKTLRVAFAGAFDERDFLSGTAV